MAAKVRCIVTNSEEGRGAFAVRVDTDETVYIPHGISEVLELEDFDEVLTILVRNQRVDPPWMAIKARRLDEDGQPVTD